VTKPITSASLAAALTAALCDNRVLGVSKNANVPINVTWIATGNNICLGGDIPRRCYWIRVDPKMPTPHLRTEFKHRRLLKWVMEHRGEIVAELLTMARAWHVAGRPNGRLTIGSYESWSETIGGIAEYAGINGFLANIEEMVEQVDEETWQWERFLRWLEEQFQRRAFVVAEVERLLETSLGTTAGEVDSTLILPDDLADAFNDRNKSFGKRLGKNLASIADRRFADDGLRVERVRQDLHRGVQTWRVRRNEDGPP
jgi:hypothetical protein